MLITRDALAQVRYDNGTMVVEIIKDRNKWVNGYRDLYDEAELIIENGLLIFKGRRRITRDYFWLEEREFDLKSVEKMECEPEDYELKHTLWLKKPYYLFKKKPYLLKKTYGILTVQTTNFRLEELEE